MSATAILLRAACCFVALAAAGCTLGPRQIRNGRLDYNQAVQESFREEMLLNLVRLRYRETPEFLSVGGIAAQYTFDGKAGAGLTLPDNAGSAGSLTGSIARTERPTISYVPARGEDFQKGLLAPISLQSLELLARTGWSWERILRATVQYANHVDNATSAGGPTPKVKPDYEEFRYLAQLLRRLQVERSVELTLAERDGKPKRVPLKRHELDGDFVFKAIKDGYTIKEDGDEISLVKSESFLALVVHPKAKLSGDLAELARILDLKVDFSTAKPAVFEINSAKNGWIQSTYSEATAFPVPNDLAFDEVPGQLSDLLSPQDPVVLRDDIVMSTRSLLEVMFYLSQGVQVPRDHQSRGLATMTTDRSGNLFDWSEMMHDLFTIRTCDKCPKCAAVSVKYRDKWFYIDERDQVSLSTFTLLIELFGIEVRAGGGGGFLYTLSV